MSFKPVVNMSPWPDDGKTVQFFPPRPSVWASVDPMYNENGVHHDLAEITKFHLRPGSYPFFTVRNRLFKLYIGWKPIFPSVDPAFYWRIHPEAVKYMDRGEQFVQLSCRWGRGTTWDKS